MPAKADDDDGFGLVEIIIAITLLGILFAAMAPVVLASLSATERMATVASANQAADSSITETRRLLGTTAGCQAWIDNPPAATEAVDERGRTLGVQVAVDSAATCDAGSLVGFTVIVTALDDTYHFAAGRELSQASSKVLVRL